MPLAYYIKLFISLAVIVGVLSLILKLSKSFHQKKYSGSISIIDRLGVDIGVTLLVVKIKNQTFLMSVGGKDIKLLKELEENDDVT